MADTSLEIRATDPDDKTVKTTITYVNGALSNAIYKEFAQKLTALTQNTYEGATKITKEGIS